jgi:hypothetical protein
MLLGAPCLFKSKAVTEAIALRFARRDRACLVLAHSGSHRQCSDSVCFLRDVCRANEAGGLGAADKDAVEPLVAGGSRDGAIQDVLETGWPGPSSKNAAEVLSK